MTRRRRRPTRKHAIIGGALALGLILLAGAWMGYQGLTARRELLALQGNLSSARTAIMAGRVDSANASAAAAQRHAARAQSLTNGPLWQLASRIPVLGQDIQVVRDLTTAANTVSTKVLRPLATAAPSLSKGLKPSGGSINLAPLRTAHTPLSDASRTLTRLASSLDTTPTGHLGHVKAARKQVLAQVDSANRVLGPLATASSVAAPMLGENGPRTYLVLFQTNAEIRSTGGMPGAFMIVRADKGRISLVQQGSPATLGPFTKPTSPLPADLEDMYTVNPGIYFQDVTMTPNWTWSAGRAREMVAARTGIKVDGVVAVDPVALSYLMGPQGVTTTKGRTVEGDAAAQYLLNGIYFDKAGDPDGQNAFFVTTAQIAFARLASGQLGSAGALSALSRATQEGRLLLWSAHPDEQKVLATTAVAGPLRSIPASPGQSNPTTLGIFLNGAIPSKMDYYLKQNIQLSPEPICHFDDLVRYRATIGLTSAIPAAAANSLPADIQGPSKAIRKGQNRVQVVGYLNNGGLFASMKENGQPASFGSGTDASMSTFMTTAVLDPNQPRTLTIEFLAKEGTDVVLRTTPLSAQQNTTTSGPVHPFGAIAPGTLEECDS